MIRFKKGDLVELYISEIKGYVDGVCTDNPIANHPVRCFILDELERDLYNQYLFRVHEIRHKSKKTEVEELKEEIEELKRNNEHFDKLCKDHAKELGCMQFTINALKLELSEKSKLIEKYKEAESSVERCIKIIVTQTT